MARPCEWYHRLMRDFTSTSQLPDGPGVYAFLGSADVADIAYVGISKNLRSRVRQHLVRRDSSIVTGATAAVLLPDHVVGVRWWQHAELEDTGRREAAELVAFEVLDPTLRSRGKTTDKAKRAYDDASFRDAMMTLFGEPPTGSVRFPSLPDVVARLDDIERRVAALEKG